jgi:hypothetical protein
MHWTQAIADGDASGCSQFNKPMARLPTIASDFGQ